MLIFKNTKIHIQSINKDDISMMMENVVYQLIMLAILICGSFFYYLTFMEYLKNKIRGL